MRYLRSVFFLLMPLVLFSLPGCGGGSSGTFSPFNQTTGNQQSQQSSNLVVAVAVSPTTIDTVGGQVVATATVTDRTTSAPVQGQPVTFTVTPSTQATIAQGMTTVTTDSNGKAIAFITPNDTPITTNVIVMASVRGVAAQTTFQIARGTGAITLPSSMSSEKTIDQNSIGAVFIEQVPFTITDANGKPRVGVPVTLSVYSHVGTGSVKIDYLADGTTSSTVTSDSNGKGIFNVTVMVFAPGVGRNTVDSIVFEASTNDAVPLVAYGGLVTNLIQTAASAITISPSTASFLATDLVDAKRTFTIAGGIGPYQVSTSNASLVTVSVSGNTITAALADASLWPDTVMITVTDSNAHTASATITRQ